MIVIGLTGGFGTGKSLVAGIFRSLGAKVLDADTIAHRALRRGAPAYKEIVKVFGKDILVRGGAIDRRKLAAKVFSYKASVSRLNRIVHPEVVRHITTAIRKAADDDVIVIDAPLLIEAKLTGLVDTLIVVTASRKNQLSRCMKKFGMGEGECMSRIGNQMPLSKKVKLADHVVNNNGTKSQTKEQVMALWRKLWR